jgi:regulator of protease activity HflC (stomatin/prohibitin superfamily)
MIYLENFALIALAILALLGSVVTVPQGSIGVITIFGKYRRIMSPGLNFKIPLIESVHRRISIQNRSIELDFQAITMDQANVYFRTMLLFSVSDANEETIKSVAFKFYNDKDFMTALTRTIEGSVRGFVATKRQSEILYRPYPRSMGLQFA